MVAEAAVITNKKYFDGFCSGWKLTAILHHHFQFYCHIKVCILRCLLSLPGFSFFFFKLQRNLRTVLRILSWRWQQLKYSIGFDLFQLDCDTLSVIKNFSHSKTCKWLTGIKSLQNYKTSLGIMATFNTPCIHLLINYNYCFFYLISVAMQIRILFFILDDYHLFRAA